MKWGLVWGPHLKAFQARAKRTGQTPAPLLNRPKLRAHDRRYLEAFHTLSASRSHGMGGPQPIQLQEVLAYFEIFGVREPQARHRYLNLVQMLDVVCLEHSAAQAEAQRKAAAR